MKNLIIALNTNKLHQIKTQRFRKKNKKKQKKEKTQRLEKDKEANEEF